LHGLLHGSACTCLPPG